jgi:transposase
VLVHAFNWKKMSLCAALAYRAQARRLFFALRPGSFDTPGLIGFLEGLRTELRGAHLTLVWDGLPAHRSLQMQAYLRAQRRWLVVERLPGYAPELNPVESLWQNVKGRELANYCGTSLATMASQCRRGLRRVRRRPSLLSSFLRHAGLSL